MRLNFLNIKILARCFRLMSCFISLTLLTTNALAATEFKIFDLQHRFAEDLLPTIQPLVGNDGAATGMQNHLIIRASPEKMIEIEQVIATLDVARQNLRITVSHQSNAQVTNSGISTSGRKRVGDVTVGTSNYPRNAPNGIQIDIENKQTKLNNNSKQFINVMDGERAFIRVGQSIPYTQEWVTLTNRYISVQKTTEFVEISTGFSVRPRSVGNQIELEITPRIAQVNQNQIIDFQELSTVVRLNHGEWLDLGAIMQEKDEVSRAILSSGNSKNSQNSGLSIKVD